MEVFENTTPAFVNAIGKFPLAEILATGHGIHELQHVIPEYFGIIVSDKKVNLGTHINSTIPLADADDIAQTQMLADLGSELSDEHKQQAAEYQKHLPRLLSKPNATEIRLNLAKSILKDCSVLGYVVLPKNTAANSQGLLSDPVISIIEENSGKQFALDGPVDLTESAALNSGVSLRVQIRLPSGAYKGFIGKWVVVALHGKWNNAGRSLMQYTESTFLTSFKISACVVDQDSALVQKNSLSVEAKVFVPSISLNYFDNPTTTFGEVEINTMDGCTMFQMPANMRNVLLSVHTKKIPMPPNIQQIYELARRPPRNPEECVYRNGFFTWIEEDKMTSDIKFFDATNITLEVKENKAELDFFLFKQQFPAPGDRNKNNVEAKVYTLLLTLTVLGSNESRPKIQVGDRIRIRPTVHSLAEASRRWNPDRPVALPFELHAIVQSFELKSEKVLAELPMLAKTCLQFLDFLSQMGVHQQTSLSGPGVGLQSRGQSQQFIKFLEGLTYQVRFHYDLTGLAFCHEALQSFLPPPKPPVAPGGPGGAEQGGSGEVGVGGGASSKTLKPLDILYPAPGFKQTYIDENGRGEAAALLARKCRHEMLSGTNVSGMGANSEYNEEQLDCISSIVALGATLHQTDLPPFCIYGPPGTGKTKCVVGSLIEIMERYPTARVLACAPSDAAADVLAVRLSRYLVRRQEILAQAVGQLAHGKLMPHSVSGTGKVMMQGGASPAAMAAQEHKLLRLNWYNRVYDSVPLELINYCCLPKGGKLFEIPNYDVLKLFRVIVTTCGVAGALNHNQATMYDPFAPQQFSTTIMPMDFDYVFVDEASQCTEAEAMIPVSLGKRSSSSTRGGIIVLAGDPKQLGPNTRSEIFREVNAKTLLERLLDNELYADILPGAAQRQQDQQQQQLVLANHHHQQQMGGGMVPMKRFSMGVMLINNYRSHRMLLEVPSKLFYGSALREAVRDRTKVDRFLPLAGFLRSVDFAASLKDMTSGPQLYPPHVLQLQQQQQQQQQQQLPDAPGVFVGVVGKQEHPLDSPSFFNTAEIDALVLLCKQIMTRPDLTGGRVLVSDIGIIGAFRAQVLRIRLALRKENLAGISVGSVEDFQGQEKQIILITTVLCSRPPVLDEYSLGLVNDSRRFNVAVTRGMGLCIVVGNPLFLHKDPSWREWIEYAELNNNFLNQGDCKLFQRHRREELEVDELLDMAAANALRFLEDDEERATDDGESSQSFKEMVKSGFMRVDQMWRTLL